MPSKSSGNYGAGPNLGHIMASWAKLNHCCFLLFCTFPCISTQAASHMHTMKNAGNTKLLHTES